MIKITQVWKLFLTAFIVMILILLPNILSNQGLFMYAGDYFFQQLPFYYHSVDIVHNYGIGWDWYTDLGSDFITAYSYYTTGSIFFWIISWLTGTAVLYAMPVMIALKTAIGAVGAYVFIRRYLQNDNPAFIGALLYAFSGYQMVSLVFNTFLDITALFPYLLFAFDLLVAEKKRGFFAFMVGLTALTNYFFFYGIVIFVVIYYIVKCFKKEYEFSIQSFSFIFLESVIGIGMAGVILLPTFKLLSSADRVSDVLYGVDLISYSDNTIIPKIIQSFFLMPDSPSGGMLFKSENNANNWASISLYLPLFASVGVVTYLRNYKEDWIAFLLKICVIFAIVPVLNSIFSMFNSAYYARWYYMPVLLMSLATAKVLDNNDDLLFGIKFESVGVLILIIISFLPDRVYKESEKLSAFFMSPTELETEIRWFSKSSVPIVFWQSVAFSFVYLLLLFAYNHKNNKNTLNINKLSICMIMLITITYAIFINNSVLQLEFNSEEAYAASLGFEPELKKEEPFRVTHANGNSSNNYSMFWRVMNAGVFHSIGMNETDIFYENAQGRKRLMFSEYNENDYPAYGLLSVKYIFNRSTGDDLNVENTPVNLKGCSLYDKQGMYYIYQNDNFVPFGFMYDYCIDDDTLENYLDENIENNKYQYKKLAMLRALVLDEADIEKYQNYINILPDSMLEGLDENTYASDCADRRAESCSLFEFDSKGYRAEITTNKAGLVFFSVPCCEGWSVKVNGEKTDIIKANYGLTAVAVEKGNSKMEFSYKTPWLDLGKTISIISIFVWLVYILNIIINKWRSIIVLEKH